MEYPLFEQEALLHALEKDYLRCLIELSEKSFQMNRQGALDVVKALGRQRFLEAYKLIPGADSKSAALLDLGLISLNDLEGDRWDICLLQTDKTLSRLNDLCDQVKEGAETSIYVELIDEGVQVWRPVKANYFLHGLFRIQPDQSCPREELWKFEPGMVVRCELHVFQGGELGLVAKEEIRKFS